MVEDVGTNEKVHQAVFDWTLAGAGGRRKLVFKCFYSINLVSAH